jgi:pantoate kinase
VQRFQPYLRSRNPVSRQVAFNGFKQVFRHAGIKIKFADIIQVSNDARQKGLDRVVCCFLKCSTTEILQRISPGTAKVAEVEAVACRGNPVEINILGGIECHRVFNQALDRAKAGVDGNEYQ